MNKLILEIKADKRQYKFALLTLLILFFLILVCGLVILSLAVKRWYVYLICVMIFILCIGYGVATFIKETKFFGYFLFDDKLIIKSLWMDKVINLKTIYGAIVFKSYVDKFLGSNSYSIKLVIRDKSEYIYLVPFISNKPEELCNTIMKLAFDARQKNK